MKIDAMSAAALAVAGVALWAFFKPRAAQNAPLTGTDMAYAMATQQRQESGAAIPGNIDYLANWKSLSDAWGNDPNAWL